MQHLEKLTDFGELVPEFAVLLVELCHKPDVVGGEYGSVVESKIALDHGKIEVVLAHEFQQNLDLLFGVVLIGQEVSLVLHLHQPVVDVLGLSLDILLEFRFWFEVASKTTISKEDFKRKQIGLLSNSDLKPLWDISGLDLPVDLSCELIVKLVWIKEVF